MTSHNIEILLVEDSKPDAKMTRRAFSSLKILNNLSIVEDGQEAWDFLKKQGKHKDVPKPDLILLDLNIPKIDGKELLKLIKSEVELKSIPVVVLTTSQADADILKSYELHANSYITKPIDFEGLSRIVQAIGCFWFKIVSLPQ